MEDRSIPQRIRDKFYDGRSLSDLLGHARAYGASDLKLLTDLTPYFRKGEGLVHKDLGDSIGIFKPITYQVMMGFIDCLTTEEQKKLLLAGKRDIDMSVIIDEKEGRRSYRMILFMEKGCPGIIARMVPSEIRTLESLGIPEVMINYLRATQDGLVLVTGPTGSGKSSTLAAMVEDIAKRNSDEIVTIEDPIEYLYTSNDSLVMQREIGRDVSSYDEGLRSAMRQDPDVIVIGEIRDRETVRKALEGTYTGHLVLGTLHTRNTVQSINRMIDLFPTDIQGDISAQLADNLKLIVSQQLPPKIGGGRKMVMERLKITQAVSNLIRKREPDGKFVSAMQTGKTFGMIPMEDALLDAYRNREIEKDVAYRYAGRKEGFMEKLNHVELNLT
jgi:twitching motility protein PilT